MAGEEKERGWWGRRGADGGGEGAGEEGEGLAREEKEQEERKLEEQEKEYRSGWKIFWPVVQCLYEFVRVNCLTIPPFECYHMFTREKHG